MNLQYVSEPRFSNLIISSLSIPNIDQGKEQFLTESVDSISMYNLLVESLNKFKPNIYTKTQLKTIITFLNKSLTFIPPKNEKRQEK